MNKVHRRSIVKRSRELRYILILLLLSLASTSVQRIPTSDAQEAVLATPTGSTLLPPCEQPGWSPDGFGLKDHAVFWYDGLYYIASIYLKDDDIGGDWFAYASSPDLCQWTDLGGILKERPAGDWDESRIWAPYVYEKNGVYYMFYTGVTPAFAQSIMLATSTNPADPDSWERQGVVFQPDHPGVVWGGFNVWSDCRDPTVVKIGDLYCLYYTGRDVDGGIVGLATAPSLSGPWIDWGAIVMTPQPTIPESSTISFYGGFYYLFYNHLSSDGVNEVYRYGPTPAGPWSEDYTFRPGWAHEVWTLPDGKSYTSFLTDYDYTITIRHLVWDDFYYPPRPFIGEAVYHVLIPLISH